MDIFWRKHRERENVYLYVCGYVCVSERERESRTENKSECIVVICD